MNTTFLHGFIFSCLIILGAGNVFAQFPTETQLTKNNMQYGTPRPAYLDSIIDPVYGTTLTRISDETAFGPTQVGASDWWAPYRRHRWFKMQPWNADGSRMLIDLTYPNYLVDGTNYKLIKRLDPAKPQNHPPNEAVWSHIDPNIMYGVSGNTMVKYNAKYGTRSTMHTFSNYNNISLGLYEGNISNDDKYVALWCPKGSRYYAVVYDLIADSIFSTYELGVQGQQDYYETFGLNWLCISQTGNYVVVQWQRSGTGRDMGIEVFDKNLKFVRQITPTVKNAYNIDMGLDADGNDVVVYQDLSNSDLKTQRLNDGLVTKVLDGSKIAKSITISCRNTRRPGWAYIGDFEASAGSVAEFHSAGTSDRSKAYFNTVFAVKLDGSESVEVFGHIHHSSNEGLYVQPMPVPSPDGKKVMFASDWEEEDMSTTSVGGPFKYTRVYNYVAEYLAPTIPQELAASEFTSGSFILNWKPSLDDQANIQYEVFKDGVSVGTTTETSMNITGLNSATKYSMTVKADDPKGNISPASQALEVTTFKTGVGKVNHPDEMFTVSVSPNPMTENGKIMISSPQTNDFSITIHDISGRKIFDQKLENTSGETIELKAFPAKSVYIMRVVDRKNQVQIRKIVQN